MKEIELTPKAIEDLENIWMYGYERFGIARADRYIQHLSATFTQLATNNIGRRRKELGEAIYSIPCISHILFYLESTTFITVMRILHHSQDVETQLHWQ